MLHLDERMDLIAERYSTATWGAAFVVVTTVHALEFEREVKGIPSREVYCALNLSRHIVRVAIHALLEVGLLMKAGRWLLTVGGNVVFAAPHKEVLRRYYRDTKRAWRTNKSSRTTNSAA